MFSRKTSDVSPDPAVEPVIETDSDDVVRRSRSHTPAKGRATPKRTAAQRRRVTSNKTPQTAEEKREAKRLEKERSRAYRQESMEGMKRGDERFLPARDKGPERKLVRDIVDSRRTVGTWFFGGAFVLLFLFQYPDPRVGLAANIIWALLAVALIVDSIFISRKVKQLVKERFPKSTERLGSLYFYAIMRAISFRRMRMPQAQVKIGDKV